MVILGGARVSEKLGLIQCLVPKVDRIAIGGAMAFTFLKALGCETGQSPVERDLLPLARRVLAEAKDHNVEILLPEDVVIATCPEQPMTMLCCPADRIPVAMTGLDIGPATVAKYQDAMQGAATVLWNGPMGMFELPAFAGGTTATAKMIAEHPGLTVAAGSDTVAAVRQAGVVDKVGYVSTAGTAFLEALEGRELPGVSALSDVKSRPY
jgi:phosphoglycerate kinase